MLIFVERSIHLGGGVVSTADEAPHIDCLW